MRYTARSQVKWWLAGAWEPDRVTPTRFTTPDRSLRWWVRESTFQQPGDIVSIERGAGCWYVRWSSRDAGIPIQVEGIGVLVCAVNLPAAWEGAALLLMAARSNLDGLVVKRRPIVWRNRRNTLWVSRRAAAGGTSLASLLYKEAVS